MDKQNSRIPAIKAAMGLSKAKIYESSPIDFGVKSETMGFIASADLITNLINIISLPLPYPSQDFYEFDKIVLHFDNKKKELWWSNSKIELKCFVNFGHVTYDYFTKCWGDGEIALTASTLLESLKQSNKAEQLMFFADPINRSYGIYGMSDINYGKRDTSKEHPLIAISEVNTHKPRVIKLDANYIPKLNEITHLKFGGVVNASELKAIVELGRKYNKKNYIVEFRPKPLEMFVTIFDNEERRIVLKKGTMIPPGKKNYYVIGEKINAPAHVLSGEVTFRVGYRTDLFYLLKKDNSDNPKGVMCAGMLLGLSDDKIFAPLA